MHAAAGVLAVTVRTRAAAGPEDPTSAPDDRVDRASHALPQARAGSGTASRSRSGRRGRTRRWCSRSDPEEIKRAYAAPPDVLQGGDAADFLEPFVGRNSILVLHGDEHLRQRRLVLPPFHGQALQRWTTTIQQLAHEHLDTWPVSTPFKALPRMQELTLEIIQRVIFGSQDPELKDGAAQRAGPHAEHAEPDRDVAGPDETSARTAASSPPSSASTSSSTGASTSPATATRSSTCSRTPGRREKSSATSSSRCSPPATRPRRPRSPGRSNGSRVTPRTSPRDPDPFINEVLRTRPVLSITARKTLQPYELGELHAARKASTSRRASTSRIAADGRSRGAAARAAAWAPRSRNWSCARCYEP